MVKTTKGRTGIVRGSGNGFFDIEMKGSKESVKLRGTQLSLVDGGATATSAAAAQSAADFVVTSIGPLCVDDPVEVKWVDADDEEDRSFFQVSHLTLLLAFP